MVCGNDPARRIERSLRTPPPAQKVVYTFCCGCGQTTVCCRGDDRLRMQRAICAYSVLNWSDSRRLMRLRIMCAGGPCLRTEQTGQGRFRPVGAGGSLRRLPRQRPRAAEDRNGEAGSLPEAEAGFGRRDRLRGMGELTLAVHAHEAGRQQEFSSFYAAAVRSFADAERLAPASAGVQDVIGAAWGSLGDRLPKAMRADAHEAAYRSWQSALMLSRPRFSAMSDHGRGEILSALAHAAHRTGRTEEARSRLAELAAVLPGTSFEVRARKWLEKPDLISRSPRFMPELP